MRPKINCISVRAGGEQPHSYQEPARRPQGGPAISGGPAALLQQRAGGRGWDPSAPKGVAAPQGAARL